MSIFPVITKEKQQMYEDFCKVNNPVGIPCICGYCGRACRQMGSEADTANCMECGLSVFVSTVDAIKKRCDEKQRAGIRSLHYFDVTCIWNKLGDKGINVKFEYIERVLKHLTEEVKSTMVKESLIIKRGYVYKFEPKSECAGDVFALAVSADARGADNIVNIILLSKELTPECVTIRNSKFPNDVMYCNCGKVTFSERTRLTEEVTKVSDKKMAKISLLISRGLGIHPEYEEAKSQVYKEMYDELLERMMNKNGKTDIDED